MGSLSRPWQAGRTTWDMWHGELKVLFALTYTKERGGGAPWAGLAGWGHKAIVMGSGGGTLTCQVLGSAIVDLGGAQSTMGERASLMSKSVLTCYTDTSVLGGLKGCALRTAGREFWLEEPESGVLARLRFGARIAGRVAGYVYGCVCVCMPGAGSGLCLPLTHRGLMGFFVSKNKEGSPAGMSIGLGGAGGGRFSMSVGVFGHRSDVETMAGGQIGVPTLTLEGAVKIEERFPVFLLSTEEAKGSEGTKGIAELGRGGGEGRGF